MEITELIEQLGKEGVKPEELITNYRDTYATSQVDAYKKETNINIGEHANKMISGAFNKIGADFGLTLEFSDKEKQSETLSNALTTWKGDQQKSGGEWEGKYNDLLKQAPDAEKLKAQIEAGLRTEMQGNYNKELALKTGEFDKQLLVKDGLLTTYKQTNAFTLALPTFDPEKVKAIGKANLDVIVNDIIAGITSSHDMVEDKGKMVAKKPDGFEVFQLDKLLSEHERLKPFISKEHLQDGGGGGDGGFKDTHGIDPNLPFHELQEKAIALVEKTHKQSDDPHKFAQEMDKVMEELQKKKAA